MEQHLGRKLLPNETVDHINGDFTDDRLENLQILTRSNHVMLDVNRKLIIELPCVYCGKPVKTHHFKHNRMIKRMKASPFCSRVCSGSYGSMVQNGKLEKYVSDTELPVKYWKLKDLS